MGMVSLALFCALGSTALAQAVLGQPAPGFTLNDAEDRSTSLDHYKGKLVVLEWVNPGCPFVRKHYDSGNMQRLQRTWTGQGIVWLSVDSSAEGKQGHLTSEQARQFLAERHAAPTRFLLDPDGAVGRRYGAKTTPHLFIVDQRGTLVYAGAIDSIPSTDQADIPKAVNYVDQALTELSSSRPVSIADTPSYGCSVKYAMSSGTHSTASGMNK